MRLFHTTNSCKCGFAAPALPCRQFFRLSFTAAREGFVRFSYRANYTATLTGFTAA